jgi:hypothetical protein
MAGKVPSKGKPLALDDNPLTGQERAALEALSRVGDDRDLPARDKRQRGTDSDLNNRDMRTSWGEAVTVLGPGRGDGWVLCAGRGCEDVACILTVRKDSLSARGV